MTVNWLHWHFCDSVQAATHPKTLTLFPYFNSLFIFEAAPESRQQLLANTCDPCDIFEFRFAHYNKLPEHVIDLLFLLLLLLFCMMQRVIRKSEKRMKASGEGGGEVKLNWLHYTDFIHKAIHCMRDISLSMCVCVWWCRLCRCNSPHMLSPPDLIHIRTRWFSVWFEIGFTFVYEFWFSFWLWIWFSLMPHRIASRRVSILMANKFTCSSKDQIPIENWLTNVFAFPLLLLFVYLE